MVKMHWKNSQEISRGIWRVEAAHPQAANNSFYVTTTMEVMETTRYVLGN